MPPSYDAGGFRSSLYYARLSKRDVRLRGMRSNTLRQIDILVEELVTGLNITIAFDCKHYNRKLNVRHVETFLSTLDDIGVSKGVIITGQGYTKAAFERARQGGRDIELRVIDFRYLSDYHGLAARSRGLDR